MTTLSEWQLQTTRHCWCKVTRKYNGDKGESNRSEERRIDGESNHQKHGM
jgi:hypothetical protein